MVPMVKTASFILLSTSMAVSKNIKHSTNREVCRCKTFALVPSENFCGLFKWNQFLPYSMEASYVADSPEVKDLLDGKEAKREACLDIDLSR